MNKLDAAATFARVEQRFLVAALTAAYPASVSIDGGSALAFVRVKGWIIHYINSSSALSYDGVRRHGGKVTVGDCAERAVIRWSEIGSQSATRVRFKATSGEQNRQTWSRWA